MEIYPLVGLSGLTVLISVFLVIARSFEFRHEELIKSGRDRVADFDLDGISEDNPVRTEIQKDYEEINNTKPLKLTVVTRTTFVGLLFLSIIYCGIFWEDNPETTDKWIVNALRFLSTSLCVLMIWSGITIWRMKDQRETFTASTEDFKAKTDMVAQTIRHEKKKKNC